MTFRVGQKVVCIKVGEWKSGDHYAVVSDPVYGAVYTVREIRLNRGEVELLLEEVRNPLLEYADGVFEIGYAAIRFRPLTESKSDISFTTGADPSTDKLDNRRKARVRA